MAGVNPAFKAFRYHYFENARDLHSAKRIKEKKMRVCLINHCGEQVFINRG
jgi:hypothetical protein